MKSKIDLDVVINNPQWTENVDFDAVKVAEEVKDLTFEYVAENFEHELLSLDKNFNLNLCLSDNEEVHHLNKEFRDMDKPTNVLSFANVDDEAFWDCLEVEDVAELGDIIIAYETLREEAEIKHITLYAHYCHLLVHGFLHILGFDHQNDEEAEEMEGAEIEILEKFSIDNPYADDDM